MRKRTGGVILIVLTCAGLCGCALSEDKAREIAARPVAARVADKAVSVDLGPAGAGEYNAGKAVLDLAAPADGAYFLQLDATVPDNLGPETVRYTFWLDGKQILAKQGWDTGYVPYFLIEGDGEFRKLTFLSPIALKAGQNTLEIRMPPDGAVRRVIFRPAVTKIDAKAALGGAQQVFFPGEQPAATITLTGPAGATVAGTVFLQQLRLADSWGQSMWSADIREVQAALLGRQPFRVTLSAKGTAELTVAIPDSRYGIVGVTTLVQSGHSLWAKYLGAAAIVPKRDTAKFYPEGIFICSFFLRRDDKLLAAYKKMGIDWVRIELGWSNFEREKGKFDFSLLDPAFNLCRKERVYVMPLTAHAPNWAKPKGNFIDIPYKSYKIKLDNAPGREFLSDWENAWKKFIQRYQDIAPALNLWNEPWEGGGISGWKSTGEHYRQLLKHLKKARDAVNPKIQIVAADSAHNTDWKIFAANMQDHVDVISTHYESPKSCMGYALKRFYNKQLWETETWMSWQGDGASVRRCLYNLALGAEKVSLWTREMLFDKAGNPTPATVWTAATRHVLDGLTFRKVVHPERPPFVLLFAGPGRQVAAVATTLASDLSRLDGQFRSQFAADEVTMALADPAGRCKVYDLLANEIRPPRRGGKVRVPVGREVRYVEHRGPAAQFEKALRAATYEGLRPVEIVLHDLPARLGEKPRLVVTLRNAHAAAISGTVGVEAQGLTLEPASRKIEGLAGAAEAKYEFTVASAAASGTNTYPTTVTVTTDRGTATLREEVCVAVIARGTPTVDGDPGEWAKLGAVPVFAAKGGAASMTTMRAWFPWEKFAEAAPGFAAEVAFAADAKHLYMMARVKDTTPKPIQSILAGKNLHKFQNPPGDYVYHTCGPMPAVYGDHIQLSLGPLEKTQWIKKYEVYPPGHPLHRFASYISAAYQYAIYPTAEGGAEVFRCRTPGFYWLHPLPMDYAWMAAHCRVPGAQAVVKRVKDGYVYEAAIPWTELRTVPHAPGDRIRLSFQVQNDGMGNTLPWSKGRSIAALNSMDFQPAWGERWSAETEWGFVGK